MILKIDKKYVGAVADLFSVYILSEIKESEHDFDWLRQFCSFYNTLERIALGKSEKECLITIGRNVEKDLPGIIEKYITQQTDTIDDFGLLCEIMKIYDQIADGKGDDNKVGDISTPESSIKYGDSASRFDNDECEKGEADGASMEQDDPDEYSKSITPEDLADLRDATEDDEQGSDNDNVEIDENEASYEDRYEEGENKENVSDEQDWEYEEDELY